MLNRNLFLHASVPNSKPEARAHCLKRVSSVGRCTGLARRSCNPATFSLLHTLSKCITRKAKKWPLETPCFPILLPFDCSFSLRLGHPQNRPGSPPGLLASESRVPAPKSGVVNLTIVDQLLSQTAKHCFLFLELIYNNHHLN